MAKKKDVNIDELDDEAGKSGKLDTLLGHGVLLSAQGAKNGSHKCP